MTTLDPRPAGTSGTPRPAHLPSAPERLEGARPDGGQSDAHLLRLCLDLQLDALLLTLGAAGAAAGPPIGATSGGDPTAVDDPLPWRRWLGEDVDLACTLAGDALDGGASLPPTLGTDLGRTVPTSTVDTLTALYASMRDRLVDLLERTPTDPYGGAPGGAPPATWHPRLREALRRCEQRLTELRRCRLAATGPHQPHQPHQKNQPHGPQHAGEHHYLPGELLG